MGFSQDFKEISTVKHVKIWAGTSPKFILSKVKRTEVTLFLLHFFLSVQCMVFGQIPRPSENLSYKELSSGYYENEYNRELALKYAKAYLLKAKKEFDSENILHGYYFIAEQSEFEIAKSYYDSIIAITKRLGINNNHYPYWAYLNRANGFYEKRKFKTALEDYLKAENAIYSHSDYQEKNIVIKFHIGLLKSRIGMYHEGLEIFKNLHKVQRDNSFKSQSDSLNILLTKFALSDCYIRLNMLDSARAVNKAGMALSSKLNNKNYIPYFSLYDGIIDFKKGDYGYAINRLEKTKNAFITNKDLPNLAENYYYLGQSYLGLENQNEGINYLKKVDSIFVEIGDLHPSLRNTFEVLVIHYTEHKKNDTLKLKYLNRLISFDSILSSNYQYLSQRIFKKFDTPSLIREKEMTIERLNKSSSINLRIAIFVALGLVATLIFSVYQLRKRMLFNRRYQNLIESLEKGPADYSFPKKDQNAFTLQSGVPEDITRVLLNQLAIFEENDQYLNPKITLNSLAKELKSNTSYLSKVINTVKKCSFSDYLSNLRISYATKNLKTNPNFRKYSIKAIAEESGFKSAETFSKKFFERHGIHPSFYIKKLEKTSDNL